MQPYAICKGGDTWLIIGSNPKIGRDIPSMFGSAYYPATYATQAAAKRVVRILEGRGVTGLTVCETPVPNGPDEDVSYLIDDEDFQTAAQPCVEPTGLAATPVEGASNSPASGSR